MATYRPLCHVSTRDISPKGENLKGKPMPYQVQISLQERKSPSPLGGKLASRGGVMPPSAVSAGRPAEEGGS